MAPPLKERMTMLRIGHRELAKLCGITTKTISGILAAKVKPQPATAKVLDQALTGEEIKLRDYLVSIHGAPQGEGS